MIAEFRARRDARRRGAERPAGRLAASSRSGAFYAFPNISGTGLRRATCRTSCSRRPASRCSPARRSASTARATCASRTPTRSRTSPPRSRQDARAARAGSRLMARRIVVTRRIPDPALDLLRARPATCGSRRTTAPLRAAELHGAVAGADAVVTMLHDRVDDALPRRGRAAAAGRRERRGRVRQRRRRRVHRARRALHEHARRPDRGDRRHRVRADPDGDAAARRGRAPDPRRAAVGLEHVLPARRGDPGQDARHHRARADRRRRRRAARARSAWTIAYSGRRAADPARRGRARRAARRLDELLARSDVVSLHCPLSPRRAT